jgi:hypothetical protein
MPRLAMSTVPVKLAVPNRESCYMPLDIHIKVLTSAAHGFDDAICY